jgi:multidrug efflux pump subunit AcrB
VTVSVRGLIAPMRQTLDGLRSGLGLAIVAIFLLLAAYFQSLTVALIVIGTIPAVIAGVAVSLFVTGSTLNVQSFMGAIMAIGVAVATRFCWPRSPSSTGGRGPPLARRRLAGRRAVSGRS